MMDIFSAEVKLLAYRYPYRQQQEYVPYRMVVDDVTHYPPLTTLGFMILTIRSISMAYCLS